MDYFSSNESIEEDSNIKEKRNEKSQGDQRKGKKMSDLPKTNRAMEFRLGGEAQMKAREEDSNVQLGCCHRDTVTVSLSSSFSVLICREAKYGRCTNL